VVRTTREKKRASTRKDREKMVMMRELMRILWKKTEQMDRESSVHSATFEVHPLPVYEDDPCQCESRVVPPTRRRLSPQSPWRRERGGVAAVAPRVCYLVIFDKDTSEFPTDGRP